VFAARPAQVLKIMMTTRESRELLWAQGVGQELFFARQFSVAMRSAVDASYGNLALFMHHENCAGTNYLIFELNRYRVPTIGRNFQLVFVFALSLVRAIKAKFPALFSLEFMCEKN
jgi:hypothetical protein